MNRIIYSQESNPYYNLSLENDLLKKADNHMLLFIWQNNRTVVIGRNQNPYLECNLDYAKSENIKIARRLSGGGAVFHDLGNVNYTFITKEKNADESKQLSVILDCVNSFGVNAVFSGRNDLLIDGRKFSGQAYYSENCNYLHHGTIMVDVNCDMASKVLTPSMQKLKSKGVCSVKSRVINLCDKNSKATTKEIKNRLAKSFEKIYGNGQNVPQIEDLNRNFYLPTQMKKYESQKWIFGESPRFETSVEKNTELGIITINLNVENGTIKMAKIYSDYLDKLSFKEEEKMLIGKVFDKKEIKNMF